MTTISRINAGSYILTTRDIRAARDVIEDFLRREPAKIYQQKHTGQSFRIVAHYGNGLLHVFATILPFLEIWFGRVQVQFACNVSLNAGDDDLHLTIRCFALMEDSEDEREIPFVTQGIIEHFSDNERTRRIFCHVVESLRAEGLIPPAAATTR